MIAVDQDQPGTFTARRLQDFGGAVLAPLAVIGNRLGFCKAICWLQDERWRGAVIRELNRLNDHYLDDIGVNRSDIDSIVDAMVRRRRERRYERL